MKDPSDVIREWVYNVLNGTIFYGATSIPVYSFAPRNSLMPYIIIGEHIMSGETGTKDAYITEHEILIEIYTVHTGNDASYAKVNSIADSCIQLLRQRSLEDSGSGGEDIPGVTGYNVIRCLIDNMVTDRIITSTNTIIYKSINVRLLLEEN